MEAQIDIEFDQLVQLARQLPSTQWKKLKQAVEKEKVSPKNSKDLESFLLTAPTFTKKQLDTIAKTRKAINRWRKK